MKNLKCKVLALCMGVSVFMCGKAFSQVPSYVPINGLVGYWPFNGNANDESGNGNNGTVNGATLTTDRNGVANKAYSFDGVNNRIEIEHNSNLNLSSISISCWINPSALLTTTGYGPTILSKREASGWGASCQMNIGNHAFWADWTISSNSGIYHTDNTNLLININTIAHFVYTHDASKVRLYLNGTLVEEINSPGLLSYNTLPLWFGARPLAGGNSSYFNGVIDDIGIWNRSLNQQEITNLYNGCSASTIASQPTNQTVNPTTSAQFVVNATSGSSFQWQTDLGLGFQNLSNAGQYSGANNDTLVVSNASISNNNQQFRCIVNPESCADTSDIAVLTVSTVGINELSVQGNVSLYPNPTQSSFEIQTNLVYSKIDIRDMQGRIVKTENAGKTITIASLQKGTYLVQLLDEKSKVLAVQQIIKE
jgi:hypothetical protein